MDWERNLYDDQEYVETRNDKKAVRVMRSIRYKRNSIAEFDCGLSRLVFDGVVNVNDKEIEHVQQTASADSGYSDGGISNENSDSDRSAHGLARFYLNLNLNPFTPSPLNPSTPEPLNPSTPQPLNDLTP